MTDSTESAVAIPMVNPSDLRSINTLDDAMAILASAGIAVKDATTEIGDGFVITEKDALISEPFVIMSYVETPGDFGDTYAIIRCVSAKGKHVITDGGTGIKAQLAEYAQQGGNPVGLMVRGFRKSEYVNEHGQGVTYYLNV